MLNKFKSWSSWLAKSFAHATKSHTLGERGERAAEQLLKSKGFRILERGWRTEQGEFDLVALDGRTIVFVEVKTRVSADPREPFEAVGPKKRKQLSRLALVYLKKHQLLEQATRFDVVGINWPKHTEPILRHYENAFEPTDRGQMFS